MDKNRYKNIKSHQRIKQQKKKKSIEYKQNSFSLIFFFIYLFKLITLRLGKSLYALVIEDLLRLRNKWECRFKACV